MVTKNIRSDAVYLLNGGFTSGEMEAICREFGYPREDARDLFREMRKLEFQREMRKNGTSSKNPSAAARRKKELIKENAPDRRKKRTLAGQWPGNRERPVRSRASPPGKRQKQKPADNYI